MSALPLKRLLVFFTLLFFISLLTFFSINAVSVLELQNVSDISSALERQSPGDWVKENQILVYPDSILLQISDAKWAKFTDTNSMDPFIDEHANALEIIPDNPESINAGDIIAYQAEQGIIIHRVIERSTDEEGIYYIVRGDNNSTADSTKVRFDDIQGVVVAVIY